MKKSNKLLLVLTLSSMALGIVSCGGSKKPTSTVNSGNSTNSIVSNDKPESPESTKPESIIEHTHTFEEGWTTDATYHWHKATCEHTDEVSGKEEHTWVDTTDKDVAPTETTEGKDYKVCSVCGYETYDVIPKLPHVHTFEEGWTTDATYHWHKATCEHTDEVSGKEEHTWVDTTDKDVAPTFTTTGKDYKKCSVCGYEAFDVLPMEEAKVTVNDKINIPGKGMALLVSRNYFANTLVVGQTYDYFHNGTKYPLTITSFEDKGGDEFGILVPLDTAPDYSKGDVIAKANTYNLATDFVATIHLLTSEEGGRRTPLFGTANPNVYVGSDIQISMTLPDDVEMIMPGETLENVQITFASSVVLSLGEVLPIKEGTKIIGYMTVTEQYQLKAIVEDKFTITGKGKVLMVSRDYFTNTLVAGQTYDYFHNGTKYPLTITSIDDKGGDQIGILIPLDTAPDYSKGDVIAKANTYNLATDFVATVHLLTKDEGGKSTPLFGTASPNVYVGSDIQISMTFPDDVTMIMPGETLENVQITFASSVVLSLDEVLPIKEGTKTIGYITITAK